MQDDPFPAAEKILSDIESVFQKDPHLREFDILPITLNQNKSPVHHVENCLGLELWCVRHVYCYAHHRLLDMRRQKCRRIDSEVQSRLLLGALLINPDVQTFWNMRRELVQAGRLDNHAELHFAAVVLSRKPKCAEAFSYRKWIVAKLKPSEKWNTLLSEELKVAKAAASRYANNYHAWQHCIWNLLHLTSADKCLNTYIEEWASSKVWATMHISDHSGWQYRQFLLRQMCGPLREQLECIPPVGDYGRIVCQFVLPVLTRVVKGDKWMHALSNEDCEIQEHASQDINKAYLAVLGKSVNGCMILALDMIISELELNTDLILRYTGHEALWYHRRFLLNFLKTHLACPHRLTKCTVDKTDTTCCRSNEGNEDCGEKPLDHMLNTMHHETDIVDEEYMSVQEDLEERQEALQIVSKAMLSHEEKLLTSVTEIDLNQQRLATQHRKWLQQVLHLCIVSQS